MIQRWTNEIKSRIAKAKPAFKKKEGSFYQEIGLKFKEATNKCLIWNKILYGAWTWTPESRSEIPGKFLNVVREKNGEDQLDYRAWNEDLLQRVKEEKSIQSTIQRRKAKWTGHILRRSCLLKLLIEGKIEVKIKWWEDGEEDVSIY